jgi:hypothetical protein
MEKLSLVNTPKRSLWNKGQREETWTQVSLPVPKQGDTGAETLTETAQECNSMSQAASALGAEAPFADAIVQFQPYGGAVKP